MADKKSSTLGNVYAISSKGRTVFGKVVYTSEYFRDLILVRLFERTFSSDAVVPGDLEVIPSRGIFTGVDSIKAGAWKHVANHPLSEHDQKMSRRTVAGDVWVGDKHVGPASDEDLARLPKMLVMGSRLVGKAVAKIP